jgi:hypothetical protein
LALAESEGANVAAGKPALTEPELIELLIDPSQTERKDRGSKRISEKEFIDTIAKLERIRRSL